MRIIIDDYVFEIRNCTSRQTQSGGPSIESARAIDLPPAIRLSHARITQRCSAPTQSHAFLQKPTRLLPCWRFDSFRLRIKNNWVRLFGRGPFDRATGGAQSNRPTGRDISVPACLLELPFLVLVPGQVLSCDPLRCGEVCLSFFF